MKTKILFLFVLFYSISLLAQQDSVKIESLKNFNNFGNQNSTEKNPIRAAAFSSIIPGLGQFYNKQYWKIPVIWGLLGIGIGSIVYNNQKKNEFKEAFLAELNGQPHAFSGQLNATSLGNAQDLYRRQMDFGLFFTTLFYLLQIVDANISAHLLGFDKNISLSPLIMRETENQNIGLALKIRL
jgi:hypothetical protein